jgi:low temperature requirement protein LtrA
MRSLVEVVGAERHTMTVVIEAGPLVDGRARMAGADKGHRGRTRPPTGGSVGQRTLRGALKPRIATPMRGRDPTEEGRAATPLELFFDLVVVAIALAADRLHHALIEGVEVAALLSYTLVFIAIWLAWVNFTWFASAYDTDDVVYRIGVFVIMTGALVVAAGVPRIFDQRDFTLAVTGYVIMRIALVTQWVRVAIDDRPRRETARRFAIGVTTCQVGWLSLLVVPDLWPVAWIVLLPIELLIPAWAERAERTTFHPEHIAERYGLFMIIVLGESVLAASLAIQGVMNGDGLTFDLASVIAGSLLIVFAMWWIYFERPEEHYLDSVPTAIAWSYLHLPIFAAAAAVGAGLVVAIEETSGHAHLGTRSVGIAVSAPIIIFLLSLWALYARLLSDVYHQLIVPVAVVLIVGAVFTPTPVLAIGLVLVGVVAAKVVLRLRESAREEAVAAV